MIPDRSGGAAGRTTGRGLLWLEWLTAAVLIAVLLALGWITAAPLLPDWGLLPTAETEVVLVLGLLVAALILVSAVALLHPRK